MADMGMSEGRNAAFQGGATGTGNVHMATSMQQNAPATFSSPGVLGLPNMYKYPASQGEAQDTFGKKMPMQMLAREIAQPRSDMSSPVMNY